MESVALSKLVLLVLGALMIAAAFSRRHRRRSKARLHQPRQRPRFLRILFVAAGVGIFVAVGYATLSDAHGRYGAGKVPSEITVPAPDRVLSPASLPVGAENRKGRLFLYLVAARVSAGTGVPVHVAPVELDWPGQRGQVVERSFDYDKAHYTVSVRPLAVLREVRSRGNAPSSPTLVLQASVTWKIQSPSYQREVPVTGMYDLAGEGIARIQAFPPTIRVLSLNAAPQPELALCCLGVLAPSDAAVRDVPFSTVQADYGRDLFVGQVPRTGGYLMPNPFLTRRETPMRGVALYVMKGLPAVLLALGAKLICMWFRARSLAFAVLVMISVLYMAVLDRATLAIDLGRLTDRSAPVETRFEACENARWTFFYRTTAGNALKQIAGDPKAPDALREAADRHALDLSG